MWRRFAENKLALFGLLLIGILLVTAAFAPLIALYDLYDQDLANTLAPPSSEHWLGTDPLGRDQLSRLIYGSRIAVVVGLASILLATIIGVALGALAGWYGGGVDSVVMRVADVFFAFPLLIGAIVIILVLGRGVPSGRPVPGDLLLGDRRPAPTILDPDRPRVGLRDGRSGAGAGGWRW